MRTQRLLAVLFVTMFAACTTEEPEKKKGGTPPPAENVPPTALASGPAEVTIGDTITLDASGSTDPDGEKVTFLWTEDEGNPVSNALDGVDLTLATISFTALEEGTFTYHVRVRDADLAEDNASVTVTVLRPTKAPTLTAIQISSDQFFSTYQEFTPGEAPVVFTTATGTLYIRPTGTDVDSAPEALTPKFSANAMNGIVSVAAHFDAEKDDDGFGIVPVEVWVEDADNLASEKQTVEIRVVPQATASLLPKAFFVDCGTLGGEGTMESPFGTIQAGYDAAVTNGADVYVAVGECTESTIQVDFDGISLYGLFVPEENWRRRTEPADKEIDSLLGVSKFAEATSIRNPNVRVLMQGATSPQGTASFHIDGLSFDLSGKNVYALSLTSPAGSSDKKAYQRLSIVNSEFLGEVTAFTGAGMLEPGGVYIEAGANSGVFSYLRNFFAVDAADGQSKFQVAMLPAVVSANAGSSTYFFSNVFFGTIGSSPGTTYSCTDTGFPYAFCFHQNNTASVIAARNLFYAQSVTSDKNPTLFDTGKGGVFSNGNIYVNADTSYKLILHRANNYLASGADGKSVLFDGVAFPPPTAGQILISVSKADYTCFSIATNLFYPNVDCSGTAAPKQLGVFNSFSYANLTTDTARPWLVSSDELLDRYPADPEYFKPGSEWDFRGRYGPGDDDGVESPSEYNIGPFEPAAPLY